MFCAIKGGLVILIVFALAACSSSLTTSPNTSLTPTTAAATTSTSATPSSMQNVRDLRYCEVIPSVQAGSTVNTYVYNTLGLNLCPPAKWNALTEAEVNQEFGQPETFGGPIRTPHLTRVQQMGLAYNRFHVTSLCSPTRAAMLTGRNHHRVGLGSVAEFPGPFPGYTSAKPRRCAALPRILQENGYVTGGFGKWHLTPDNVQGAAGPFDHWPLSWGFDHYWGFLSGAAGPI